MNRKKKPRTEFSKTEPLCLYETPSQSSERRKPYSLDLCTKRSQKYARNAQTSRSKSPTKGKRWRKHFAYYLKPNEILHSKNNTYQVLSYLGKGGYGVTMNCVNLEKDVKVAIKFNSSHPELIKQGIREAQHLCAIRNATNGLFNIVQFVEQFAHKGHMCLVFEKLERTLLQYIIDNNHKHMTLRHIRPIAQQLCVALRKLSQMKIIHADLKTDNIMLVDTIRKPFAVKIIDFGRAIHVREASANLFTQTRNYRSPEILLGLRFKEAADMWSVGCVIGELFLGEILFPGYTPYDVLQNIILLCGEPTLDMLDDGIRTTKYYNRRMNAYSMKTTMEYRVHNNRNRVDIDMEGISSFEDIRKLYRTGDLVGDNLKADRQDRKAFIDLLKCILTMDQDERITPAEVLRHPFITLSHLEPYRRSKYVQDSIKSMEVCSWYDAAGNLTRDPYSFFRKRNPCKKSYVTYTINNAIKVRKDIYFTDDSSTDEASKKVPCGFNNFLQDTATTSSRNESSSSSLETNKYGDSDMEVSSITMGSKSMNTVRSGIGASTGPAYMTYGPQDSSSAPSNESNNNNDWIDLMTIPKNAITFAPYGAGTSTTTPSNRQTTNSTNSPEPDDGQEDWQQSSLISDSLSDALSRKRNLSQLNIYTSDMETIPKKRLRRRSSSSDGMSFLKSLFDDCTPSPIALRSSSPNNNDIDIPEIEENPNFGGEPQRCFAMVHDQHLQSNNWMISTGLQNDTDNNYTDAYEGTDNCDNSSVIRSPSSAENDSDKDNNSSEPSQYFDAEISHYLHSPNSVNSNNSGSFYSAKHSFDSSSYMSVDNDDFDELDPLPTRNDNGSDI